MSNHQILNPADHAELRIRTEAGVALGDAVTACLAVPAEFRRLACEFPILFRYDAERGSFSSLALMGFEQGENLYLQGDQWDAACRPLAMAVQPFLIGRSQDDEGPSQVHIDMAHPRIAKDGGGIPVFDEAEELLEDSGELLVLEMVEHDGEGYLEPIADEDLFNTIAHMFMERLEEEFDFVEE